MHCVSSIVQLHRKKTINTHDTIKVLRIIKLTYYLVSVRLR